MKHVEGIGLPQVQEVYSGPEGDLWRLVMGQQIHIGGLTSSLDLARRAGIVAGSTGVDLCCCNGAGMRCLLRFAGAAKMIGVDATPKVLAQAKLLCQEEGVTGRVEFRQAEVAATGLADSSVDFVWGEDAWCYVADKPGLIAEAARVVRPGGTIAFTDWVETPKGLSEAEGERFCRFMKFPNIEDIAGYRGLLESVGCRVEAAEDTGRFAPHCRLYIEMLSMQLTYDALKIIGFDQALMQSLAGEMQFQLSLAEAGKIAQGLFVATKP